MPRPRKPTVIRMLEGGRNKQRLNPDEPVPTGKAVAPAWLSPEALAHWNRLAPILERMRVLTEADVDALAILCRLLHRFYDEALPDPRVATEIRGYLARFGLTPADRGRVSGAPQEDKSKAAKYLGGVKK